MQIDISRVINNPLFTDTATLERNTNSINSFGETEQTTITSTINVVIQPASGEDKDRLPDASVLGDAISVYYVGEFEAFDVLEWRGKRYIYMSTPEVYNHAPSGWVRAIFILERGE